MPKKEKLTKAGKAFAKGEFGAPEDTTPKRNFKIDRQVVIKVPTAQERLEVKNDRSPETQAKNEKIFNAGLKKDKPAKKAKKVKAKKKKIPNTATPAAQKLADEHGILIAELDGGVDNRISVGEVKAAIKAISGE